ncbi:Phosphoheptose isomerase 1 [hydrothermal vent metagenome]|uniref:D-sedoheptulose-7-phosphate isomerase n=1 Tax=hydrothermal vent metagenome TaxID=652676 RepID=A0A1W1BFP3_9ZZZZ
MKTQQNIKESIKESISVKQQVLKTDVIEKISQMAELISTALENGHKLLLCGNGGSAADAQHLAAELVVRLRSNVNRRALPAISLAMDSSAITACANDFSFEQIFERSLEALGQKGDVLLGISTSGNSKNVQLALKKAQEMGIKTIAFLGCDGGNIKGLSDVEYIVPSDTTGRVQEVHIMLGHILMETIEDDLINSGYTSLK